MQAELIQQEDVQDYDAKVFNFVDTTATQKVFELSQRIRAVAGGTSASKTISILVWIIDYCQQKQSRNKLVSVISESHPHLEKGAILDFQNIMKDRGYWKREKWNESKHTYTFETGNKLEFYSVDTYGKAHGPRRDVLFLNECNNLPWIIVDQLMTRTREIVWMDWNPSEEFWFYTEIKDKRTDVDFITLTYLDNEALDEIMVREIESHMGDTQWWPVYGLGQLGTIETRIYKNWEIVSSIPKEARLVARGLDFGYTNDPTALVDIYKYNGGYIIDESLYQAGMTNPEIAQSITKGDGIITIADSSEPKSIAEIALHGISIIGSKKGKGSISHGIDKVHSVKISVTKWSLNVIKEYRNYLFVKDNLGKITNVPRDLFNHSMDAIRYAIAYLMPDIEKESDYVQPDYEAPGIGTKEAMGTPILTIQQNAPIGGSHKDRMMALRNRQKPAESTYETDTPWQKPGL